MAYIQVRREIEKNIKDTPDLVLKYVIENIDYFIQKTDGIGLEVLKETLEKKGIV